MSQDTISSRINFRCSSDFEDSGADLSRDFLDHSLFRNIDNFGSDGQLIPFNIEDDDSSLSVSEEEEEYPILDIMAKKIKALEAENVKLKEAQIKTQKQNDRLINENDLLKAQLSHSRSIISTFKEDRGHISDDILSPIGLYNLNISENSDTFLSPIGHDEIEDVFHSESGQMDDSEPIYPVSGTSQGITLKKFTDIK